MSEEVKTYEAEFKDSYGEYAVAANARSLPSIHDGLKAVHRRILYACQEVAPSTGAFRKSAVVTSKTVGDFHPAGDSVYDTMVRMVQLFNNHLPLFQGQGNFGSVDGSSSAAQRYTELRISKICDKLIISDIKAGAFITRPNYDNTLTEPVALPVALPLGIINGVARGLGAGTSSCYPPHNPNEVVQALILFIKGRLANQPVTVDDILKVMPGPDFPIGCTVSAHNVAQLYRTGENTNMTIRCNVEVIESTSAKKGDRLIFTGLPYETNTTTIVNSIIDQVRPVKKKVAGKEVVTPGELYDYVHNVLDQTDKDKKTGEVKAIIEVMLKPDVDTSVAIERLFTYTKLQSPINLFASNWTDSNFGLLQSKNIIELFDAWLDHRINTLNQRYTKLVNRQSAILHQIEGLKLVLSDIDNLINIIKTADNDTDVKEKLSKAFGLSDIQADYVIRIEIRRLNRMSQQELDKQHLDTKAKLDEYIALMVDPTTLLELILSETESFLPIVAKIPRRTKIEFFSRKSTDIDLIPPEDSLVFIQEDGAIIKAPESALSISKRGNKGLRKPISSQAIVDASFANTRDRLLVTTQSGNLVRMNAHEIPIGRGTTLAALGIKDGHVPMAITNMPRGIEDAESSRFVMVTNKGVVKKILGKHTVSTIKAIINGFAFYESDHYVVSSQFVDEDDFFLVAANDGKGSLIKASQIRTSKRNSGGINIIANCDGTNRTITGFAVAKSQEQLLFAISGNGVGRLTKISGLLPRAGRTKGQTLLGLRPNDWLAGMVAVDLEDTITVFTKKGRVITLEASEIPVLASNTTIGSAIMRLDEGDFVVHVAKIGE